MLALGPALILDSASSLLFEWPKSALIEEQCCLCARCDKATHCEACPGLRWLASIKLDGRRVANTTAFAPWRPRGWAALWLFNDDNRHR